MDELEKMGAGRLAVAFSALDALGHTDFVVRRCPGYRHRWFVREHNNGRWCLADFEMGVVEWKGGTFTL